MAKPVDLDERAYDLHRQDYDDDEIARRVGLRDGAAARAAYKRHWNKIGRPPAVPPIRSAAVSPVGRTAGDTLLSSAADPQPFADFLDLDDASEAPAPTDPAGLVTTDGDDE